MNTEPIEHESRMSRARTLAQVLLVWTIMQMVIFIALNGVMVYSMYQGENILEVFESSFTLYVTAFTQVVLTMLFTLFLSNRISGELSSPETDSEPQGEKVSESSFIHRQSLAVDYPNGSTQLDLSINGVTYRYFDIPIGLREEFLSADSKGTFFNQHIRGQFEYTVIGDTDYDDTDMEG